MQITEVFECDDDYMYEIFSIYTKWCLHVSQASFWRGNVTAVHVVILLRVLARTRWRKQVIKCWRFYYFEIGRGFNLLQSSQDDSANFSCKKKYNEAFQGVYFLTIGEKTLN